MRAWLTDFKYGARMIAKRPGTSAIAIIALAFGIGLTTTMFSIVQGAILRGLPFPESERIMHIGRAAVTSTGGNTSAATPHDFVDWRDRQQSFESFSGFAQSGVVFTGDGGFPERFRSARVTPDTFGLLRVSPFMGRDFTAADAEAAAPAVAIISHRVWTSRFASDPNVLTRDVRLDNVATAIVGVMPEKFGFPNVEQVWLPLTVTPGPKRGEGTRVRAIGRLKPGVTEAEAAAEMAGIARQLAEAHVENKDVTARVTPYVREFIGADVVATLFAMLGAVFGVMLIACVNVTNLQLARAAERAKETAIRAALGSGRWRILRQSLAEGLLLAAAGAALGLGIAQTGIVLFNRAIVDTSPPFWIDIRLDPTVLVFVTGITVAAALVSSALPGWRVARADAHEVLKDDGRGTTSLRMGRFSRWLVVVEVAVSCVLLVVSGLMIRSILATSRTDYPFATEDVFTAQVSLDSEAHASDGDVSRVVDELLARLGRLPGVRSVAVATGVPNRSNESVMALEGRTYDAEGDYPRVNNIVVTPSFFDTLRVSVKEGRLFDARDADAALPVVVIGEDLARRHFPDRPAVGQRLRFSTDDARPWRTVIGVVPALVPGGQPNQTTETVYIPMAQQPSRGLTVLASTAGDPLALTAAVRTTVAEVSDRSPMSNPNSLALAYWESAWAFRVFGGLFMTFGVAALLLAAAGLYGVMAFSVRRRTQEIGVRMALGAHRGGVLRMILWQGLWRVSVGVVLGLVPGWWLGTQMSALLANVSPLDPIVFGTTVGTLLTAGAVACLAPALRAASVDPVTALRRD